MIYFTATFDRSSSRISIEELSRYGTATATCPYFLARSAVSHVDIAFLPYNYLLDGRVRRSLGLSLRDVVIVLDEAHNVDSVAAEAASFDWVAGDVARGAAELDAALAEREKLEVEFIHFFCLNCCCFVVFLFYLED